MKKRGNHRFRRFHRFFIISVISVISGLFSWFIFMAEPIEFTGAKIAKWYDNHTAALSITFDSGNPASTWNRKINDFVVSHGLTMDYEVVTHDYHLYPHLRDYLLNTMIPSGLGYFGHGDKHINHDLLSYEEALASFKKCYRTMREFGLKPAAYAYPNGKGHRAETREALAESGFLCGRLHYSPSMTKPYIVPGGQQEPGDWYALPTLVMQDYEFEHCKRCVNNNQQLIPYLDETLREKAWIILTYHAIGKRKKYGFYELGEFKKDLQAIKTRDFWNAPMNAITLYIRERLQGEVKLVPVLGPGKEIKEMLITVSDGLPNDIYDQPLTILMDFPASWLHQTAALVENKKIITTFVIDSIKGMISIKPDENQRKIIKLETMK